MKLYFSGKFTRLVTLLTLTVILPLASFAQNVEMADDMRRDGKIYIVVAVCLTILIGLILYVVSVDYKLRKLEKESPSHLK